MQNEKIEIYTDGSCIGNPGPGGWGVIAFIDGKKIALSGGEKDTTNNRMEMMGIIGALELLHKTFPKEELPKKEIILYSDSNLLIQTLNLGWKKKANTDLWAQIDALRAWLNIKWTWVKAHAQNKYNNEVDVLAYKEAEKMKRTTAS